VKLMAVPVVTSVSEPPTVICPAAPEVLLTRESSSPVAVTTTLAVTP
jgi:hypothetical protein